MNSVRLIGRLTHDAEANRMLADPATLDGHGNPPPKDPCSHGHAESDG